MCCCCRCFPGGFEESPADPGTAGGLRRGEGLACCPLPPGKPWHLLPRLSCQPFSAPLPAPATGDVISMVTTSGALGHLGPEGATKGRPSVPVSPSQGPTQARVLRLNRDLGCRAGRILEQLGAAGACLPVAPFPTSLPSCGTSSSPQPCAEIPVPPQKHTLSVHRGFWKHERIRDALSTMPGSQRVLSKSVLSVV